MDRRIAAAVLAVVGAIAGVFWMQASAPDVDTDTPPTRPVTPSPDARPTALPGRPDVAAPTPLPSDDAMPPPAPRPGDAPRVEPGQRLGLVPPVNDPEPAVHLPPTPEGAEALFLEYEQPVRFCERWSLRGVEPGIDVDIDIEITPAEAAPDAAQDTPRAATVTAVDVAGLDEPAAGQFSDCLRSALNRGRFEVPDGGAVTVVPLTWTLGEDAGQP